MGAREGPMTVSAVRMTVSIVIPSWNGWPILSRCLPHVLEAAGREPGTEIIVSDDGSTDGTPDLLRKSFQAVRVVAGGTNGGFARAANSGVKAAAGDAVVCLNNDVRPEPGFLRPLIDALAGDETLFASAPRMINAGFGGDEARTAGVFRRGLLDVSFPDRDSSSAPARGIAPILYACGGAAAFRRDRFLALGGFNALFHPFYWEDVDLSWRARRRGWGIVHVPDSVVHHEGGSTIGARFARREVQITYERNRLLFIWSNLLDAGLWRRHLAWLGPRASLSALRRGAFAEGLARAASRMKEALYRRNEERQAVVVSDRDILAASSIV